MADLKYTVIKTRKQYDNYCQIVDELLDLDETSKAQDQELELLTVLIEKWDADHSPMNRMDPIEIIKSLMKDHALTATDLTEIMDVSKSHVSEILSYKKGLSKGVIRRLAGHFKMSQDAFNRTYTLKGSDIRVVIKSDATSSSRNNHNKVRSNKSVIKKPTVQKAASKTRLQNA